MTCIFSQPVLAVFTYRLTTLYDSETLDLPSLYLYNSPVQLTTYSYSVAFQNDQIPCFVEVFSHIYRDNYNYYHIQISA